MCDSKHKTTKTLFRNAIYPLTYCHLLKFAVSTVDCRIWGPVCIWRKCSKFYQDTRL